MTSPISEPLRKLLKSSRLSHVAIEQATGVDRASISRFLAGERSLRLDVADRLAVFLGLTLTKGANMAAALTTNIFCYSAASEVARMHYHNTMQRGLALAQVVDYIDDPQIIYALRSAYPEGTAYLWAGRSGGQDEHYWRQMESGDLVLCYRDRRIVSYSYVVSTVQNLRLGRFAWPDETNRPFDLVYFLTAPQPVDKPVAELPDYLGEVYQGLRRLAASEKIVRDFGSPEAFVKNGLK